MGTTDNDAEPADGQKPPAGRPSQADARRFLDEGIALGRAQLESGEPGIARLHFDKAISFVRRW